MFGLFCIVKMLFVGVISTKIKFLGVFLKSFVWEGGFGSDGGQRQEPGEGGLGPKRLVV